MRISDWSSDVCSSDLTLDEFLEAYGQNVEANWDRRIYLASSATLMDVLRDIPEDKSDLLMLGHNPGLEDLILSLVSDDGTSRLRDEVAVKFPTASLAVIEIDVDKWNDVGPQTAKLACFIRPRDLDPTLRPAPYQARVLMGSLARKRVV